MLRGLGDIGEVLRRGGVDVLERWPVYEMPGRGTRDRFKVSSSKFRVENAATTYRSLTFNFELETLNSAITAIPALVALPQNWTSAIIPADIDLSVMDVLFLARDGSR
jgi:hypothetical protein